MALEREFEISLPDKDMDKITDMTVRDVVEFLDRTVNF
jgi:acyl carrier protein